MLSDTVKRLPAIKVGDNVRVPIPIEDRVKLGQKHLLGVVTSLFGSSYTVGTIRGTLDRKYRRGEIALWKSSSYLSIDEIPKTEIKLRTAAKFISNNRILHQCQCGGRCVTKHCPCRIDGFNCTSCCHPKIIGKCRNSQIASKNTTPLPKKQKLNTDAISINNQTLQTNYSGSKLEPNQDSCSADNIWKMEVTA